MILDKLKVIIDADTSGLKSGINQARSELNKFSTDANNSSSAASTFAKEMEAGAQRAANAGKVVASSFDQVQAKVGKLSDNAKIRAA